MAIGSAQSSVISTHRALTFREAHVPSYNTQTDMTSREMEIARVVTRTLVSAGAQATIWSPTVPERSLTDASILFQPHTMKSKLRASAKDAKGMMGMI